jgi:hypothetical protein
VCITYITANAWNHVWLSFDRLSLRLAK